MHKYRIDITVIVCTQKICFHKTMWSHLLAVLYHGPGTRSIYDLLGRDMHENSVQTNSIQFK